MSDDKYKVIESIFDAEGETHCQTMVVPLDWFLKRYIDTLSEAEIEELNRLRDERT
jgi:hypothetical protein